MLCLLLSLILIGISILEKSIKMSSSNFIRRVIKQHQVGLTHGMEVLSTEMLELSSFGESIIKSHEEPHSFSVDNQGAQESSR